MDSIKIPFDQVNFSKRDKAYQLHPEQFEDFIFDIPKLQSFAQKINDRKSFSIDRELLSEQLRASYQSLDLDQSFQRQLDSLKSESTFTVCTAHQSSLFTGPLYYILKIASTINLANQLKAKFSECHFVPVFVHGAEDHDLEEINHCFLFNKEIIWNTAQSGATGRMGLDEMDDALSTFKEVLGNSTQAIEIHKMLDLAFAKCETYGEFNFHLIHQMFAEHGLVQLNMDSAPLKKSFIPYFKKELFEGFSFEEVSAQILKLEGKGFSAQANPREINLFYLSEGRRDRIVKDGVAYQILGTEKKFSQEQILAELEKFPERFSPNVIMRPLYQELVLPNLAYVGGGGELAYWLERKSQFAKADISFPILVRRNSAAIMTNKKWSQWSSMNLTAGQLFANFDTLSAQFSRANHEMPEELLKTKSQIETLYSHLAKSVKAIDPSLERTVQGEMQKAQGGLSNIEGKLVKVFKQKSETSLNRIRNIQALVNPLGSLQERKSNYFQFYLAKGVTLTKYLIENLNPLETDFQMILID